RGNTAITNLARTQEAALVILAKYTNDPRYSQVVLNNFVDCFLRFDYKKAFTAQARIRFSDSGSWLTGKTEYRDWIGSSRSSILWLTGPAGVGKTILSTLIIEHLAKPSSPFAQDCSVLYSLHQERFNSDSISVLCTLIHQL